MINKISFKNYVNDKKKEINLKEINIIHSPNTNQAGKTTLLESISATFLFNNRYINDQLLFNENEEIRNLWTEMQIEDEVIYVERFQENEQKEREFRNYITTENGKQISKEDFENGSIIEWPSGIRLRRLYREANTYSGLERHSFSFGIYYQLFYIDEKIGWTKYDVPKVINSYSNYNKYNINMYLASLINTSDEVEVLYSKFEEKFKADLNTFSEYIIGNQTLKNLTNSLKISDLSKLLSIEEKNSKLEKIEDKHKEITLEIITLKKEREQCKSALKKEEIVSEYIKNSLNSAIENFGENIRLLFEVSNLELNANKNAEFLKERLKSLNKEIRLKLRKSDELTKELSKVASELDAKEEYIKSEERSLTKSTLYSELKNANMNHSSKETKVSLGMTDNESIYEYIRREIILNNRKIISEKQKNITNSLIEYLKINEKKFDSDDFERMNEQLNSLMKNLHKDNFYLKGAFENIQVLTERLAIVDCWKKEIPIFIVDSPLKGEIEKIQTKCDHKNIYRTAIIFLLTELIRRSKSNGGPIEQIFISSASIENEKEEIFEILGPSHTDIKWILMKGIFKDI